MDLIGVLILESIMLENQKIIQNLKDQNTIYSNQKIDDNNPMIVLLFDMLPDDRFKYELDQDSLPNFESFINNNIYFTNAYSPGSHTVTSASSIFYGKLITEIEI